MAVMVAREVRGVVALTNVRAGVAGELQPELALGVVRQAQGHMTVPRVVLAMAVSEVMVSLTLAVQEGVAEAVDIMAEAEARVTGITLIVILAEAEEEGHRI